MAAAFISQVEHEFFENLVNDFLYPTDPAISSIWIEDDPLFDDYWIEAPLPFPDHVDHVDLDLVAQLGEN